MLSQDATPGSSQWLMLSPVDSKDIICAFPRWPTGPFLTQSLYHTNIALELASAIHVLSVETAALSSLIHCYQNDNKAASSLILAIEVITATIRQKGKLITCAVGKSAFVASKMAATLKSLGVAAGFMHATEALHGDIGNVGKGDVVLFVSFSGTTTELREVAKLLLTKDCIVIALTGWTATDSSSICPLLQGREVINTWPVDFSNLKVPGILLPASIQDSEEKSFGVSAPTTSTTVAMAVCDMLALRAARQIHGNQLERIFAFNHPGGAIGSRLVTD